VTLQRASVPSGKTDYGWYIVSIDKLAFGDITLAGGGLALLDTGTTNLKMPQDVSQQYGIRLLVELC
jgi:hypothetical protein